MVKIFTLVLWNRINVGRFTPRLKVTRSHMFVSPRTRSGKFTKISIPLPWWYTLTPSGKFAKIPVPPLGTRKTYPDPERKRLPKIISQIPVRYPEDIPRPRAGGWHKYQYPYPNYIPVPWSPFTLAHTLVAFLGGEKIAESKQAS
jgi:hypothetical protein